ncbi:MAG TPA: LapA family protein [bacterium]|nr:LapA family protein [bacterium]
MTFWKKPKFIAWTLLLLLFLIVILQNVEPTQVDFLFWSLPAMPKLVLILLSMIAGAGLALVGAREFRSHGRDGTHKD